MTFIADAVADRITLGEFRSCPSEVSRTSDADFACETLVGEAALGHMSTSWAVLEAQNSSKVLAPDALQHVVSASEDDVRLVIVRRAGAVVLVWPFAIRRLGPLTQAVRLGRSVQCYDDVIVAPSPHSTGAIEAAWTEIAAWGDVDFVALPQIVAGSPLLSVPIIAERLRVAGYAPGLDLRGFTDAQDYRASLSKNRRGALKRKNARLAKNRDVTFHVLEDADARRAAVAAAMEFKRAWLDARDLMSIAYGSDYFERAFLDIATCSLSREECRVFTLCVDGEIVAVEIGIVAGTSYHSHIGAFSLDWAKDGVGSILTEMVIGSCIEAGFTDYDMLMPDTPFKRDWTREVVPVYEALVPISRMGRLTQPVVRDAKGMAKTLQAAMPAPLRRAAKSLVSKAMA